MFPNYAEDRIHQANLIRVLDRNFNNTICNNTNYSKIWKNMHEKDYPAKYYTKRNLIALKEIFVKLNKAEIIDKIQSEIDKMKRKTNIINKL